jgi:putative ABC transport system permease protein
MGHLRYAWRTLTASPGFTLIAIATLALGIGANTAIFSVVNGVLLRPLPFGEPDRIVRIYSVARDDDRGGHSAANYRDLERANQSLAALAGYRSLVFGVAARQGEATRLDGSFVTAGFFDVLGVAAEHGRAFTAQVDTTPGERRVVLSHDAATTLYGSGPQAVDQRLRVDGEPHTVVGVMPPRVAWPSGSRMWVLSLDEVPPSPVDTRAPDADRDVRYFEAIARLRADVSLPQARDDLRRVGALIAQEHGASAERTSFDAVPIVEEVVGNVRAGLLVLQAAVGLVLLIACANVSSLLIARSTGRQRELAIRAAIGASRRDLVRQLFAESLALAVAGGAAGLLLGGWLTRLLVSVLPGGIPRTGEIRLDLSVAAMTMLVALATAGIVGVMPAVQASRTDAATALKRAGERGSTRARARAAFVVVEVALTLVLLAGAGLLVNSFVRLQRTDSGLRAESVTLVPLMLPQSRYPTGASQTELYRRLMEGAAAAPRIQAVGVGFPRPLRGSRAFGTFFLEGRPSATAADRASANIGSVSGGYFAAIGVPLVAGRTFTESDTASAPRVAVVNATLAAKYWPGGNALGKRLRFDDADDVPWFTIVGIVGDVRQLGLDQAAPPIVYFPYAQFALPFTDVAIRSDAPQSSIVSLVRARLAEIDPDLPIGTATPLEEVLGLAVAQPRFRAALISAFAALALVLAAVGVFGLISHSVSQRTREIGIRIALGARQNDVLGLVFRESMLLAAIGIVLGLGGALASGRMLRTFLYGVHPHDPLTLAVVSGLLLSAAALASYVPARRALRVDPIDALRAE